MTARLRHSLPCPDGLIASAVSPSIMRISQRCTRNFRTPPITRRLPPRRNSTTRRRQARATDCGRTLITNTTRFAKQNSDHDGNVDVVTVQFL